MKKLLVPLMVLLMGATAYPAEKVKIGFINLQEALNESEVGKKAKQDLEQVIREKQAEVEGKVKAKDAMREDLEKQSVMLSEDARNKRVDELRRLEREIERLISDTNAELQKLQREKEVDILKELDAIIGKIGKEEGFTLILPSDVVLYAVEGLEITDKVIEEYDKSSGHKPAGKGK
jgi:outer membrane protein